jgi:hypothetical protein
MGRKEFEMIISPGLKRRMLFDTLMIVSRLMPVIRFLRKPFITMLVYIEILSVIQVSHVIAWLWVFAGFYLLLEIMGLIRWLKRRKKPV